MSVANYEAFNGPRERQDAALNMCLKYSDSTRYAEEFFSRLTAEDFDPGHRMMLATIIVDLLGRGELDSMRALSEARKVSAETVQYLVMLDDHGRHYRPDLLAQDIAEDTRRRKLAAVITRAQQQITSPESDVATVEESIVSGLEALGSRIDALPPDYSLSDILDLEDDSRPWVIPNMLRSGEVTLLTGWEGAGKSLLSSQIALGAACGINTMTMLDEAHDPVKVYVLDVENDPIDIRENMRKIWPLMSEKCGGLRPDISFSGLRFTELTNVRERRNFVSRVCDVNPGLITMGSVYKLAPVTDHEVVFNSVLTTVREIQERTGAAFLIEHHAGNAKDAGNERESRPYGSSMWRRWPNFGIGLVRHPDMEGIAELVRWRGDRARGRTWPRGLRERPFLQRDVSFPWIPIQDDEWEARFDGKRSRS